MYKRILLAALVAAMTLAPRAARAVVTNQNSPVSYTCAGTAGAKTFTITFPYLSYTHFTVTMTNAQGVITTLTPTTDYTISPTSSGTVGTLTLVPDGTKCPAGSVLKITRVVPNTQSLSLSTQGPYSPKAIEGALDSLEMQIQGSNNTITSNKASLDLLLGGGYTPQPLVWTLAPDGIITAFTINGAAITLPELYQVTIDGVVQKPTTDYTINTSTQKITFTSAPAVNASVVVRTLGYAQGVTVNETTQPGAGSRTPFLNVLATPYFIDNTGNTDVVATFTNAIAALPVGGTLRVPAGTYKLSGVGITLNKSMTLEMDRGATLTTAGTSAIVVSASKVGIRGGIISVGTNVAAQFAINPSGTVSDLTVEDVTITGQGTVSDGSHGVQTGFGNTSGPVISNLKIRRNTLSALNVGISLNADLSGSITGALVENNHISNIVGVLPGNGYGIHHANGSGSPSYVRIRDNFIETDQRHAIYQAKGSGVVISGNEIRLHRTGVSDGSSRAAIVVSRSQEVAVSNNYFDQPADGAISVTSELSTGAGNICRNITISNNIIMNPKGSPPLLVGGGAPATDGFCENVTFNGNAVYNDTTTSGYSSDLVRINEGKRITFTGNTFYWLNATNTNGVWGLRGTTETAGTALYTDDIKIADNTVYTTNASGAHGFAFNWLAAFATSGIRLELSGNRFNVAGSNVHVLGAAVTDPNIIIDGPGQTSGLTAAVGTSGSITLVAGTGTATVPAGVSCFCTDTTANASCRTAVVTNTLTVTGTGTDVIKYHCD